ncbi:PspC domain-containing protein [Cohnella cellulosilytica]|uniref:PspC domain-containing protein n=1 Tax=Cohnella cellulosilytica TaxID=986710 RepID=A0ABW2FL74_9BACL
MRKLYRSTRDRKLFGVCGGLADFLGVDATLLRILLIVVAVFSAGSVVLVYIIAGFVIPREPYYGGFGPGPYDPGYRGQDPYYGYNPGQGPSHGPSHGPSQGPSHGPSHGPGWNPNSSGYAGYSSSNAARPNPAASASSRPSQGLDAMMEDIEKKSMQKEIEELKARISKFEKDSKGE